MVQVDSDHYRFLNYMSKARWLSLWHQIHEVLSLSPETVLEIGIGRGAFRYFIRDAGVHLIGVDWEPSLTPDCVANAELLPFRNDSFDVVACFQVLEHMPYNKSVDACRELCRVAKSHLVLSLPDSRKGWGIRIKLPFVGTRSFLIRHPRIPRAHHFDGQHHWEIGKKGFSLQKVTRDLERLGCKLMHTYQIVENPYHRFFVFKVNGIKKDESDINTGLGS